MYRFASIKMKLNLIGYFIIMLSSFCLTENFGSCYWTVQGIFLFFNLPASLITVVNLLAKGVILIFADKNCL